MDRLDDVIAEGHRSIIFSQFTSFLDQVAAVLERRGVPHVVLDGSTRNRGAVVESFRSGEAPVFLISLKAGGFGLNLTEADYVFLMDPWWNPATENQAIDRAHRIGQTKSVMVYRYVAEGTIEEKVLALQKRKAELFDSLMSDSGIRGPRAQWAGVQPDRHGRGHPGAAGWVNIYFRWTKVNIRAHFSPWGPPDRRPAHALQRRMPLESSEPRGAEQKGQSLRHIPRLCAR